MTAQVVRQSPDRHRPILLECPLAQQLLLAQPAQQFDGRGTGRAERRQHLGRIGLRIGTLPHQGIAIDRSQQRIDLIQQAPETQLIAVDLDIPHMA